jgi:hypothetical protein
VDQIGLFGNPVIPISPLRIVSICIIAIGVALLLKSGHEAPVPKTKTADVSIYSSQHKEVILDGK